MPTQLIYILSDTPLKKEWSLTARPGWLRLYGGCYDLTSPESPTMLLRKQTSFNQLFQAVLDFEPSRIGYESGIVVWWNSYSFASIGIIKSLNAQEGNGRTLILRVPTDTLGVTSVSYQDILAQQNHFLTRRIGIFSASHFSRADYFEYTGK